MLGCMGSFTSSSTSPASSSDEKEQFIYLHGYISGRLFRSSSQSSSSGLPITISATFLDGLVLSLTPFHNSCNYRSAVVFGYAELVEDRDEAMGAMRGITENLLPGRWEGSRVPPTEAEIKSTGVIRVRIESGKFVHFPIFFFHFSHHLSPPSSPIPHHRVHSHRTSYIVHYTLT